MAKGASSFTTNYELSQYQGVDIPQYIGEAGQDKGSYNDDMFRIDAGLKENADAIAQETLDRAAETASHTHDGTVGNGTKVTHADLLLLDADDHPQYIKHSIAEAANDFLIASGAGAFVRKTVADIKTLLGLGSAAYTPSTDYATAAHEQSATTITSGTLLESRLPIGIGTSKVAQLKVATNVILDDNWSLPTTTWTFLTAASPNKYLSLGNLVEGDVIDMSAMLRVVLVGTTTMSGASLALVVTKNSKTPADTSNIVCMYTTALDTAGSPVLNGIYTVPAGGLTDARVYMGAKPLVSNCEALAHSPSPYWSGERYCMLTAKVWSVS